MKRALLFILFTSFTLNCFAQKRTVTGTIYDEDKNSLAFANVIIKNSEKGVISNEKGQFSIEVNSKDILEVSYLGFETQEISLISQKEIAITLKPQWEQIDTVEITVDKGLTECRSIICTMVSCTTQCRVDSKDEYSEKIVQKDHERILSLYPNPSINGIFQLQLNDSYMKLTLEVFNMNGQLIQSNTYNKLSKNPQIDLSKQAKGMYLVRIVADGTVLETKKAIRS